MNDRTMVSSCFIVTIMVLGTSIAITNGAPRPTESRISEGLQHHLESHDRANVMIVLVGSVTDVTEKYTNNGQPLNSTQIQAMVSDLIQHAAQAQKRIAQVLNERAKDYEGRPSYLWISNEIGVKNATTKLITDLAVMSEIQEIRLEGIITLD